MNIPFDIFFIVILLLLFFLLHNMKWPFFTLLNYTNNIHKQWAFILMKDLLYNRLNITTVLCNIYNNTKHFVYYFVQKKKEKKNRRQKNLLKLIRNRTEQHDKITLIFFLFSHFFIGNYIYCVKQNKAV